MKKRILTVLLSLAILVTFMPTMAFADTNVAVVTDSSGNTVGSYTTIDEAVYEALEAGSGSTVTLIDDATVYSDGGISIVGAGELNLNLNGYTLHGYYDEDTFTVAGSTIRIDGTEGKSTIVGSIKVAEGVVKINGGTYVNNNNNSEDGVIMATTGLQYGKAIIINNANIISDYKGVAVRAQYFAGHYDVKINNTYIKAPIGVDMGKSRLMVDDDTDYRRAPSTIEATECAICADAESKVSIYDGKYIVYSRDDDYFGERDVFYYGDYCEYEDGDVGFKIYGGAYSNLPLEHYVAEESTLTLLGKDEIGYHYTDYLPEDLYIVLGKGADLDLYSEYAYYNEYENVMDYEYEEMIANNDVIFNVQDGATFCVDGKKFLDGKNAMYKLGKCTDVELGIYFGEDELGRPIYDPIYEIDILDGVVEANCKYNTVSDRERLVDINVGHCAKFVIPKGITYNLIKEGEIIVDKKGECLVCGELKILDNRWMEGLFKVEGTLLLTDNQPNQDMSFELVGKDAKIYSAYDLVQAKQFSSTCGYTVATTKADRTYNGKVYDYAYSYSTDKPKEEAKEEESNPNAKDINTTVLPTSIPTQAYTGQEVKPTVKITDGNAVLVEGTDYRLEYSNNVSAGEATLVVKGINNYKGSKEYKFQITTSDKAVDDVIASIESLSNVTLADEAKVVAARAAYEKLTAAQQAKVLNIKNLDAAEDMISTLKDLETFKGMKVKSLRLAKSGKKVTVKWAELGYANFDGYKVYRSQHRGYGYKCVKTTEKTKFVNKNLKKGKKYYYKVRGYVKVGNKTYFTKYSVVKAKTIK